MFVFSFFSDGHSPSMKVTLETLLSAVRDGHHTKSLFGRRTGGAGLIQTLATLFE
jgi:hypothetical protein